MIEFLQNYSFTESEKKMAKILARTKNILMGSK